MKFDIRNRHGDYSGQVRQLRGHGVVGTVQTPDGVQRIPGLTQAFFKSFKFDLLKPAEIRDFNQMSAAESPFSDVRDEL